MMPSRKLKILFITKWYPDKFDPQTGVFIQKHAGAVAQYCDTALLYITRDPKLASPFMLEEKKNGSLHEFILYFRPFHTGIRWIDRFVNLLYYFLYAHLASRVIAKSWGRQDLTHAVVFARPVVQAWLTRQRKGIPFLVSEHWSGFATGEFRKKSSFYKSVVRFLAGRAGRIIVVSDFLRSRMISENVTARYEVVPNIVDPALVLPSPQDSPLIRILVVADLVDEIKNVSAVIRAFHSLASSQPNAILQIIGDGPDRSRLETLTGETGLLDKKIFFHGRMDNVEVYKYLSECSFLVMNSKLETFSLICAEALCCGKPVVATRCGGPESFLSDETGMLIEPGNEVQLTEAIQKMILQFRKYNPEKLRLFATDHFSAERIGKMYLDIYQNLLSTGKDSTP